MLRKLLPPIATLLFVSGAYAALNNPVPTGGISVSNKPHEKPKNDNPYSNTQNRGTDIAPFVIKFLNPPYEKACSTDSTKEVEKKTPSNLWNQPLDWSSFFTGWLVVVGVIQGGLFVWQLIVMKRSIISAEVSASASQKAAEAAEKQLILAREEFIDSQKNSVKQDEFRRREIRAYVGATEFYIAIDGKLGIKIRNSGKSPAFDLEQIICVTTSTKTKNELLALNGGKSISPFIPKMMGSEFTNTIHHEFDGKRPNIKGFYINGLITYKDIFEKDHETLFNFAASLLPDGSWIFRAEGENYYK